LPLLVDQLIISGLPVAFELGTELEEVALEALLDLVELQLVTLQVQVPLMLTLKVTLQFARLTLQVCLLFFELFHLLPGPPEHGLYLPDASLARTAVLTLQPGTLLPRLVLHTLLRETKGVELVLLVLEAGTQGGKLGFQGATVG